MKPFTDINNNRDNFKCNQSKSIRNISCVPYYHGNNTNNNVCKRKKKFLKHLRLYYEHLQLVTNRKRSIYIELLPNDLAIMTIETMIIYQTIRSNTAGHLKSSTKMNNHNKNIGLITKHCHTDLVRLINVNDIGRILIEFNRNKSLNSINYGNYYDVIMLQRQIDDEYRRQQRHHQQHREIDYQSSQQQQQQQELIPLSTVNQLQPLSEDKSMIHSSSLSLHDNHQLTLPSTRYNRLIGQLFHIKSSISMTMYRTTTYTQRVIKNLSNLIGF